MKKTAIFLSAFLFLLTAFYALFNIRDSDLFPVSGRQTDDLRQTIILDPGHGGFDGGATAVDGTPEKAFNLQIALKLRDFLQFYGFQVVMTRTEDAGTEDSSARSLREKKVSDIRNRMALVNNTQNCILMSIHQNYFEDASCKGTQVFYSKNTTESKNIAQTIQQEIAAALQPANTRVIKGAGSEIYLLDKAKRPAVLVECGFISNKDDAEKLLDGNYQKQLALCIAKAMFHFVHSSEV